MRMVCCRSIGTALRGATALCLVSVLLPVAPVSARTFVSVGIGLPGPGWYGPPAYYYAPPPVVYAPPPVVYVPPPAVVYAPPVSVAPPAAPPPPPPALWYYCDNPAGYYPYVATCGTAWRAVAPQPPAN